MTEDGRRRRADGGGRRAADARRAAEDGGQRTAMDGGRMREKGGDRAVKRDNIATPTMQHVMKVM